MKILKSEQIRLADAYTIEHEPISSTDLMERAGTECFNWIYENAPQLFPHVDEEKNFLFQIVCGTGNNGGDGLVIARMLQRHGYSVEVFLVRLAERGSDDFEINLERLSKRKLNVWEIHSKKEIPKLSSAAVIIDALIGTGLNRPAEGLASEMIDLINESTSLVISIDMPSGMSCDGIEPDEGCSVVRADYLLTFQVPKLSFFMEGCVASVGEIITLDIGLHREFLEQVKTDYHLFSGLEARLMRRVRPTFSHKGTYGHLLIIAGARGKRGASILAASGALHAGAGLITVHTDLDGANPLHSALPEVGPGLGVSANTERALKLLIQESKVPLVIDADALNILSENPTWLSFLPPGTILTPHPGEFARLMGGKSSHSESIQKQSELSKKHNIYIVLKGAHTSTSLPDGQIIFNMTGNPGMATGGMGDVLTGIITALRGQGYGAMEACVLGVYLHGLAGDLALENQSVESLTPTDLIGALGRAFQTLNAPRK